MLVAVQVSSAVQQGIAQQCPERDEGQVRTTNNPERAYPIVLNKRFSTVRLTETEVERGPQVVAVQLELAFKPLSQLL